MVEIRFIAEDEIVPFRTAVSAGFGGDLTVEESTAGDLLEQYPIETCLAAFDRGRIVATLGSFHLDLAVPGGSLPTAGTTVVTVSPTHRRRGLLTSMMKRHLLQAVELGEPLAALWASEELIYRRFGYGQGAEMAELTIPGHHVTLPAASPEVSMRALDLDEARTRVPPVHARVAAETPGSFQRWDGWWRHRHFDQPPDRRPRGMSLRRYVVAERDGSDVGYLVYHQKEAPSDGVPQGSIEVVELLAEDDDARRALWHFAANIDLFPNVHHWNAPTDDPVLIEADRFRSLRIERGDSIWIRVLDVAAALAGRRYERDGSLVLAIEDPFLARGGVYTLDVSGGVGHGRPSDAEPDVTLDVAELGSLLLGGAPVTQLARAGRLRGDGRSLAVLDDLFGTARAPHCVEVF